MYAPQANYFGGSSWPRDESTHLADKGLLDPPSAYENVRFL
jgi:hypothetical protein